MFHSGMFDDRMPRVCNLWSLDLNIPNDWWISRKNRNYHTHTNYHKLRERYEKCWIFKLAGVGKCPNWTSPNYWGYNLQQILEGDVQNPQKGTFTNPWLAKHIPRKTSAQLHFKNYPTRTVGKWCTNIRKTHKSDSCIIRCFAWFHQQPLSIIPTDAPCCPDISIEDVVLSNMIGEITENTASRRSVFWFRIQSFQGLGFRLLGFRLLFLGNLKTLAKVWLSMWKDSG